MNQKEIDHELRAIELAISNKATITRLVANSELQYRDIVAPLTVEESEKLFKALAKILKEKSHAV